MTDSDLGGDKRRDILSELLSIEKPGGGGLGTALHCLLVFLCLLLIVFISNRGEKKSVAKLEDLPWRGGRRVVPGGRTSALQYLYSCWIWDIKTLTESRDTRS